MPFFLIGFLLYSCCTEEQTNSLQYQITQGTYNIQASGVQQTIIEERVKHNNDKFINIIKKILFFRKDIKKILLFHTVPIHLQLFLNSRHINHLLIHILNAEQIYLLLLDFSLKNPSNEPLISKQDEIVINNILFELRLAYYVGNDNSIFLQEKLFINFMKEIDNLFGRSNHLLYDCIFDGCDRNIYKPNKNKYLNNFFRNVNKWKKKFNNIKIYLNELTPDMEKAFNDDFKNNTDTSTLPDLSYLLLVKLEIQDFLFSVIKIFMNRDDKQGLDEYCNKLKGFTRINRNFNLLEIQYMCGYL